MKKVIHFLLDLVLLIGGVLEIFSGDGDFWDYVLVCGLIFFAIYDIINQRKRNSANGKTKK